MRHTVWSISIYALEEPVARDTRKVNLTLNKKTVEALDRMAAEGHRTRTQQVEKLVSDADPGVYPMGWENSRDPIVAQQVAR